MSYGKLGSKDLTAATDELICTLAENQTINIRVSNRTANDAKIRIAIGTGVSPDPKDYIRYDTIIEPGLPLEDTGIAVSSGEKVWVRSDIAGCCARVYGVPE